MRPYTESFKRKMVQRLLAPGAAPAVHIASETGVHQTTLSRWVREARTLAAVTTPPLPPSAPPSPPARRPEDWTAEEKLLAVERAGALSGAQLGEFLRREGLHEAQLTEWRKAALEGLRGPAKTAKGAGEAKRVRDLERQLRRKDKALAEAAALLVLQKKVQALWGDGDDDTDPETDR
jgi:transposase-like protein